MGTTQARADNRAFNGCSREPSRSTFTFDDKAGVHAARSEYATHGLDGGHFRPVESLSSYVGMPARGDWTLHLMDDDVNGNDGTLESWTLSLEYRSCNPEHVWSSMTSVGEPPRRYGHTAIALDSSMFVFGGMNTHPLSDLWRYDTAVDAWTELTPVEYHPPKYPGSSVSITPWGILRVGGSINRARVNEPMPVWLRDMVDPSTWHAVNTTDEKSPPKSAPTPYFKFPHPHRSVSPPPVPRQVPRRRYWHTVSLIQLEVESRPSSLHSTVSRRSGCVE